MVRFSLQPPLSYWSLRDMQQSLRWIVNGSCITSTQTYQTIVCDPGSFRKSAAAVASSCSALGIACKVLPAHRLLCPFGSCCPFVVSLLLLLSLPSRKFRRATRNGCCSDVR